VAHIRAVRRNIPEMANATARVVVEANLPFLADAVYTYLTNMVPQLPNVDFVYLNALAAKNGQLPIGYGQPSLEGEYRIGLWTSERSKVQMMGAIGSGNLALPLSLISTQAANCGSDASTGTSAVSATRRPTWNARRSCGARPTGMRRASGPGSDPRQLPLSPLHLYLP
jgi:hypothetical protein